MSIETTTTDSSASNQNNSDENTIPNPERGCGYLKQGKAYLRSDVGTDGNLPAFVSFEEPVPFKEDRKRSYKQFPGIQFELAVTGTGGLTETSPPDEITAHLERLDFDRPTGTTAGEMVEFESHDLLMSVGKTHYPTVEEFVAEARIHGVNKAISVTSGNEPPVVNPGRTRLFLIHPRAVEVTVTEMEEQEVEKTERVELPNGDTKTVSYTETEMVEVEKTEYVPGIFGYTYLTRCVYTEDADGNIPKYVQDYEATGSLDVVTPGEPVPYSEQEGFDADGNPVDDDQQTLAPEDETHDLSDFPEMEARVTHLTPTDEAEAGVEVESIEDLERADLAALVDAEAVEGYAPPEGEDALYGDDSGALAVVEMEGELFKLMPSNNVSFDDNTERGIGAVTHLGPYTVAVTETSENTRRVEAERAR